jgi:hypothetical protein
MNMAGQQQKFTNTKTLNPKPQTPTPYRNIVEQQQKFTNTKTLNPNPQHLTGILWSSSRTSQIPKP